MYPRESNRSLGVIMVVFANTVFWSQRGASIGFVKEVAANCEEALDAELSVA